MRTLAIAGLSMVTAISATQAGAQHVLSNGQIWQNGHIVPPQAGPAGQPIRRMPPQMPPIQQPMQHQSRWGGSVAGHWQGGMHAPGGWNAYRRPTRGWIMPHYWMSPSFFIFDYGTYGLSTPPQGYTWSRYYDDAVLMDQGGRIYDSVSGIDWDRYDSADAYGYGGGSASAGYGYAAAAGGGGGYGASYPQPQPGPGTWSNQPAPYPAQPAYAPPPPPPMQGGYTTSSGYTGSGGYISGGYWYPPVTTTTVTIQSAPVVTTTTTEYIETTYAPVRHVYRAVKRKYRPAPRRTCSCGCCR